MRIATLFLLCLTLSALAADSLNCVMVDWLDAYSHHNFAHEPQTEGYYYSGTAYWDLATGDSFIVWLPGSNLIIIANAYDDENIDTVVIESSGSADRAAISVIDDSIYYQVGSGFIYSYLVEPDSLKLLDYIHTAFADYHFAALEDSFLYTMTPGNLTCVNVADPESIFIYRTYSGGSNAGLEAVDGYAYEAISGSNVTDYPPRHWPFFNLTKIDMINSASPHLAGDMWVDNRCLGDLASDGEFVYYVNSYMSDGGAWTIGESDLYVWDTDTSYNFDSRWDGQGVFGVDVIDTHLIAAGFEHGFSVLNISDLSDIHEIAYYIDCDSVMDFTHFALKENRLYAMGHLDEGGVSTGTVRLYMFQLSDSVITGQVELENLPEEFRFWNYPNPFNSSCRFAFSGFDKDITNIEIYDINGRLIESVTEPVEVPGGAKLPSTSSGSGSRTFVWQPDASLGSGVYLIRIKGDKQCAIAKAILLK